MDKILLIKDFPSKGIHFRHIGPLLEDPKAFDDCIGKLLDMLGGVHYDRIGALDSRGFILATAIMNITKKPMFMIRKASKLPGETYQQSYNMEYGEPKIVEIEKTAVKKGERVLLVDDLLATGGTLTAGMKLVEQAGGLVTAVGCFIGLDGLGGAEAIRNVAAYTKVRTLFNYPHDSDTLIARIDPIITEYRPTSIFHTKATRGKPVLIWYPTLEAMAQRMLKCSNYRPSYVDWDRFPDKWSNITFEGEALQNLDVTFLFSMSEEETFLRQEALAIALPRQQIRSLTIVIPYMAPATHERVERSGMLATVEPVMKMISRLPQTKEGVPIVRIVDIHALPIRFYSTDEVQMKMMTAIPRLQWQLGLTNRPTIAFPDQGAYKRFREYFKDDHVIICGKMRGPGDERTVTIEDRMNWPIDESMQERCMEKVLIVDDLAQSGGTLLACASALKKAGFKTVQAYVTHAVFPNRSWEKFRDSDIQTFYVSNTNPQVTEQLRAAPFCVLDIEEDLVKDIALDVTSVKFERNYRGCPEVYVASTNAMKLEAVRRFYPHPFRVFGVSEVASGVPEQPFGKDETVRGAHNRLNALKKIIGVKKEVTRVFVAIENGIVQEGENYDDIAIVAWCQDNGIDAIFTSHKVKIPKETYGYVERALAEGTTYGSLIEKAYGIPKGEWHMKLARVSRIDQILSAIKMMRHPM